MNKMVEEFKRKHSDSAKEYLIRREAYKQANFISLLMNLAEEEEDTFLRVWDEIVTTGKLDLDNYYEHITPDFIPGRGFVLQVYDDFYEVDHLEYGIICFRKKAEGSRNSAALTILGTTD